MAAIVRLPQVWTRQPPGPLPLDLSNPLTRGIMFVSQGGSSGYDAVSKAFPATVGTSVTQGGIGPRGKAETFSSTGYRSYANTDSLIFGGGYTVLSVARTTNLSAQSGLVSKWDSTGNNVPMTFFVRASGELALWRNVGGGNNGTQGTTTTPGGTTGLSVISTNRDFVASVDAGGTVLDTASIYLDGALRFSGFTFGPSGSNVPLSEPTGSTFGVGASNGGGGTWQGLIYLTVCWNRRLSAAEHLSLHANPWQIFAPASRVFVAPGATGYLLTADAGSYAIAGQDATLTRGRIVSADAGSYAIAGQDATLTYTPAGGAFTLTADAGAYVIGGQNATILKGRVVTADAGAYAIAGKDATLTWSPAAAYTLTAEAGAYVISGQSAEINVSGATQVGGHFLEKDKPAPKRKTVRESLEDVLSPPVEEIAAEVREALQATPEQPAFEVPDLSDVKVRLDRAEEMIQEQERITRRKRALRILMLDV